MVICPIARAVHCTGCVLFKFCPAKTTLGDYGKEDDQCVKKSCESKVHKDEEKPDGK
jgi:hypothetical protein